jgi:hypothetical protein
MEPSPTTPREDQTTQSTTTPQACQRHPIYVHTQSNSVVFFFFFFLDGLDEYAREKKKLNNADTKYIS